MRIAVASAMLSIVGATGLAVLGAAPAHAAYCTTSTGVNVVVDYGTLGGVAQGCGTGTIARVAFTSAGNTLTAGPGGPDTVCQVNAVPAAGEECWGRTKDHWYIFVARQGGSWAAATVGIDSLRVKPGDSVALVWQGTTSQTAPGVAAASPVAAGTTAPTTGAKPAATAKPTKHATTKPKATRSATPTRAATPSASASATTSPTATASGSASGSPSSTTSTSSTPSAGASATPTGTAVPDPATVEATLAQRSASTDDGSSLPGWVPPIVLLVLVGAIVGVTLVRRRAR
ncbi:hypothetical protein [Nocardioides sp.]|uniref:hypothetical protein n=1 Tax=Nocardioides sp. TaxID=35761 RepID=UPI0026087B12|nr:hypothetical protein [Nocardioides sp.]